MTEENLDIIKHIEKLTFHANNYESIFLELFSKHKKIPEDFLNNYLELISEIDKNSLSLKKGKNEEKNLLGTTK